MVFLRVFSPEFRNEKSPLRNLRAGLANVDFSSLQVGARPSTTSFTDATATAAFAGGRGELPRGGAMVEEDERAHRD
jgi:hypothetical protein